MSHKELSALQTWGWDEKRKKKKDEIRVFYDLEKCEIVADHVSPLVMVFADIPREILRANRIPKNGDLFPIIGIQIQGQGIEIYCWLCSDEEKKVKKSQCLQAEKHAPYIFLVATDTIPIAESEYHCLQRTVFALSPETCSVVPIVPLNLPESKTQTYRMSPLYFYYWFFLAVIVNQIPHPNQPEFYHSEGDIFKTKQKEKVIQQLRKFHMTPSSRHFFCETFPLFPKK